MNATDLCKVILNNLEMIIPLNDAIDSLTNEIIQLDIQKSFIENSVVLISTISQNHSNIQKQEQDLIDAIETASKDIKPLYKGWLDAVHSDIFEGITELVKIGYKFEPSDLKCLIDYIIYIKYDDVNVFTELFVFLTSLGHILPMETFGIGMYILERHGNISHDPEIHPNYVYNPQNDIQHKFDKCIVCGGEGVPYKTGYSFKMHNFGNPHLPFRLFMKCEKCNNCYSQYVSTASFTQSNDVILANPQPNNNVIVTGDSFNKLNYLYKILNKISKINNKKEFLNIGIGVGEFLAVGLELGYEVTGVAKTSGLAQNISNMLEIPIYGGDVTKFNLNKTYPIIILDNYIEKVCNPKEVLLKINDLLDDDGVLWLSTINTQSAYLRLTKENSNIWFNHLNVTLFCKEGLEMLLNECGFEVIEYEISKINYGFMELVMKKSNNR